MFKANNNQKKAFTLVELIVVIVILAILSTIAFLSFFSQSSSARDSTRMSDIANISKGLVVFNAISGKYPLPDNKVSILSGVTLLGYQGYAGDGVTKIIKLSSNGGKDPIDNTYYTYNINYSQSRYQLLGFLENSSSVSFDYNPFDNFSNDSVSALSYANRYPYEKGDILGIILDKTGSLSNTVYTPIQDISSISSEGKVDVTALTSSGYFAFIDNTPSSMTGVIIISIGKTYVSTGTTTGIQYNNCGAGTYSGYTISALTSLGKINVIKPVTYGTGDITVSCFNGNLSYGVENINCISNYVLQSGTCVADLCTGNAPDYSISNGVQKVGVLWNHNITTGQCTYVCQAGYYSNGTTCIVASVGNYVSASGATMQTQCALGEYQSSTGQTSCILASIGNYVGTLGSINQSVCALGSYQSNEGQSSCTLAGIGNYVGSTGKSSQTQCALGSYQGSTGQSSCVLSTTGQYQDTTGQSTFKSCSNKPTSNSVYTVSSGLGNNTCPWNCNVNYHNESNVCVSDIRSCTTITGIIGTQYWGGSSWGTTCVDLSLKAYWDMETLNVPDASDVSGNGWNGTVLGGAVVGGINGNGNLKNGKATYFDGVDDSVQNYGCGMMSYVDGISLNIYANISQYNPTGWYNIAGFYGTAGSQVWGISENSFRLMVSTTGQLSIPFVAKPLNEWHMYTLTYDKNNFKGYIDGILINSIANINQISYVGCSGHGMLIGSLHGGSAYPYKGIIDEVRLFNRALSDIEVTTLYNSTK